MAAELEDKTGELVRQIESSGGVFEVEYKGKLIFSKKSMGRFPEEAEVWQIISALESGMDLEQAKQEAAKAVPKPPTFMEWFMKRLSGS